MSAAIYRKTFVDLWHERDHLTHQNFSFRSDEEGRLWHSHWDKAMSHAVYLDASGVSRVGDAWEDVYSYPSPVPPWPVVVVEPPSFLESARSAVLLECHPTDGLAVDGATHRVTASVLFEAADRTAIILPPLAMSWALDLSREHPQSFDWKTHEFYALPPIPGRDRPIESDLLWTIREAVFAVCMCNAKNVHPREHRPPAALSKRHQERHGRPLVRYYTLDITPMRKALETEGRLHEVGLPKALHLCRGHFKDYRGSKGLFGKYKGLFWWDVMVRGSATEGAVLKDYRIPHPGDAHREEIATWADKLETANPAMAAKVRSLVDLPPPKR